MKQIKFLLMNVYFVCKGRGSNSRNASSDESVEGRDESVAGGDKSIKSG